MQYDGQKEKKGKKTNNSRQQHWTETKNRATRTPLKSEGTHVLRKIKQFPFH